jgi:hypothetical protein
MSRIDNTKFKSIVSKWTQECEAGKDYCKNMPLNMGPGKYANELVEKLGLPTHCSKDSCTWIPEKKCEDDKCKYIGKNKEKEIGQLTYVKEITMRNEQIKHDRPIKHIDFVYSTADIKTNEKQACLLNLSSRSIINDQLKGEITARCGHINKNQITLGFANNAASENSKLTIVNVKSEYENSIRHNRMTEKFPKI